MKIVLQLDDKITLAHYPDDDCSIHFDGMPHGWMRVVSASRSSFFRLDSVLACLPDDVPLDGYSGRIAELSALMHRESLA